MNNFDLPISLPRLSRGSVVSVDEGKLLVRASRYGEVPAVNAVPGWRPAVGDRVLTVDDDGAEIFVIGVVGPPAGVEPVVSIERTDRGARITLAEGELEIAAEQVRVTADDELALESGARVRARVHDAGSETRSEVLLDGSTAHVHAGVFAARAARLALLAEEITAAAERVDARLESVRVKAGRVDLDAEDLVERAGTVIRSARGLMQLEAGRLRWVAKDSLVALAKRAKLKASAVFAIDGDSIHLG